MFQYIALMFSPNSLIHSLFSEFFVSKPFDNIDQTLHLWPIYVTTLTRFENFDRIWPFCLDYSSLKFKFDLIKFQQPCLITMEINSICMQRRGKFTRDVKGWLKILSKLQLCRRPCHKKFRQQEKHLKPHIFASGELTKTHLHLEKHEAKHFCIWEITNTHLHLEKHEAKHFCIWWHNQNTFAPWETWSHTILHLGKNKDTCILSHWETRSQTFMHLVK